MITPHPFNKDIAKLCKWPLVTRDGRRAEVLKWDRVGLQHLVGLITSKTDGWENSNTWTSPEGTHWSDGGKHSNDLFLSADYTDPLVRAAVQAAHEKMGMEVQIFRKSTKQWVIFQKGEKPGWLWGCWDYRLTIHLPPADPIAPGHNPDKLTESQVGEGFRLLDRDEVHRSMRVRVALPVDRWEISNWADDSRIWGLLPSKTYRTRLLRAELADLDAPEEKKLPEDWCREMKITVMDPDGWNRQDFDNDWTIPLTKSEFQRKAARSTTLRGTYRPSRFAKKPFDLRNIPGFRPLLPTEQNHRDDFTQEDLPEGWRPLLMNEIPQSGDNWHDGKMWIIQTRMHGAFPLESGHFKHRTRRPLPSIPKIVQWDCAGDVPGPVCYLRWLKGPKGPAPSCWTMIVAVCDEGVICVGSDSDGDNKKLVFTSWDDLAEEHENSLDRITWLPCTKEEK